MIRVFKENDISVVMQIWLDTNIKTHSFISKCYWMDNYDMVKKIMPQAEIYVYEDNITNQIEGFIGLTDNYIAGLFVKEGVQSKGIGKQLLNYAKGIKSNMRLSVYNKNIRAIKFYQREQFVIQSENTDDNTNEKELIMVWSR
ncbi:MAG: GNAT family N-acetyltransferase [Acutalibacteraceae bacterium]